MRADPGEILHRVFGYSDFRGRQAEIVDHVIAGGDALVLMPTGGGKSICYQVPALCRAGTGLVVSPLIALMDDQVSALRQLGINAGALHSELDADELSRVHQALNNGQLDLLYISPERLLAPGVLDRLRHTRLALIAIDEAHCVSAWGHEFRPEYRGLQRLAEIFPGVPRMALTATADPRTRADILASLDMRDAAVFLSSFHRPNLLVGATPKLRETQQLQAFLGTRSGMAGIVYCGSRAKTERVAASLAAQGLPAMAYHAGMAPIEKRLGLSRFRSGEPVVVVATIAFGMGIDRPDVRYVVHLDMPDSPESFYQQIGRAGRDGETSHTLLLYGAEDMARARRWLAQSQAGDAQREIMRQRLDYMIGLAETTSCRTRALLQCFGESLAQDCGHCDNCLQPAAVIDGTLAAQKALSAVYRTGQMFGVRHVVSVLRGDVTDAITRYNHHKLALFGIGREFSDIFWRGILRQLVSRGALRVRDGDYAVLELDQETARPILRGEVPVMLRDDAQRQPVSARTRRAAAADTQAVESPLFEALRAWRLGVAKAQSVPPYVIFHDTVLREIAGSKPGNLAELGEIKGVGLSKLQRYGDDVLTVIKTT